MNIDVRLIAAFQGGNKRSAEPKGKTGYKKRRRSRHYAGANIQCVPEYPARRGGTVTQTLMTGISP